MTEIAAATDLELVQAFANTLDLDGGSDELATPEAAGAWLAGQGLVPDGTTPSASELARLAALREAVRALLRHNGGGDPAPEAAAVLDETARRAGLAPRFTGTGSVTLEPAATGVDGAAGRLVAAVERAMREGSWPRLKLCAEHTCEWAFVDASRNRSGRWCSMAVCGNRQKSRRAYRRRRAAR